MEESIPNVERSLYDSEARNGRKWHEKISFTKYPAPANGIDSRFLSET
jgi:hypothetical protein